MAGANFVVGLTASFMVFGAAWVDDSLLLGTYLGLGVAVPFVATGVVTHVELKLEGRWRADLAWVNAFAYAPIYALFTPVAIGEAIRRGDPLQLIWVIFLVVTLGVSLASAAMVRSLHGGTVVTRRRPAERGGFAFAAASGGLAVLLFALIYALSYMAEDRTGAPSPTTGDLESAPAIAPNALSEWAGGGAREICHRTDDGGYEPTSVSSSDEAQHLAHGDGRPGPYRGMIFDDACFVTWDPVPGEYERMPRTNDWHRVTILRVDATTLQWANRAGVTWALTATDDPALFETGPGYPYADSPYTFARFVFGGGDPYGGAVSEVTGPGGEPYRRLPGNP
jgi:hypothetical protein